MFCNSEDNYWVQALQMSFIIFYFVSKCINGRTEPRFGAFLSSLNIRYRISYGLSDNPFATLDAIAVESVQPVPCVLFESIL